MRIHPQAKEVIQMHEPASYSAELHAARSCAAQEVDCLQIFTPLVRRCFQGLLFLGIGCLDRFLQSAP